MKKYEIGIGQKTIEGLTVDAAQSIEADMFTIEPCGAVTFWKIIIYGEKNELVLAMAPGEWKTVSVSE